MSVWKKNGTPPVNHEKTLSLLGEGSNTKGDFFTPGALRVEGRFQGSLRVEGRLVLAQTAEVKGHIHAAQVLIAGQFEGQITAEELLEVASTAQIKGEIRAKRMEMQGGARLEVRCWVGETIDTASLPSSPATEAPAPSPPPPQPLSKNRRGS
ncbi:MAG: polymer-forming cytoskeletal protein [Bacteroidia bacterium]|nr:polymer-forming cytoskeletal protein [Bacteroidia bacterium]